MNRQQYDSLVRTVEARYSGRPLALERATARWVRLGLVGVLSWLGLLTLLSIAALVGGLFLRTEVGPWLLVAGALASFYTLSQVFVVLSSNAPPSDGQRLQTGQATALVQTLADLCRKLQCRPFDEVRITGEFNAGVREFPRLGLLGWPRSILEIGLPLLLALNPEELLAVMAHEFAHLSARHGRGGRRLARLHRAWAEVFQRMQRPVASGTGRLARSAALRCVNWYWPRLNARAQVLSRAQEFQADRFAAEHCGGGPLVASLWRMECLEPWFSERFWPDLYRAADHESNPPDDLLTRMRTALNAPLEPADADRWVARGLARGTVEWQTHPSFPDRARALGLTDATLKTLGIPAPAEPSAAEALLGLDLEPIAVALNQEWRRGALGPWRERHRRATAEDRRHSSPIPGAIPTANLDAGPSPSPSPFPTDLGSVAALWEEAQGLAARRSPEAAEPLLRSVLERSPDHPGASVLLGQHLLQTGRAEGERLLWSAVERSEFPWTSRACESLQVHYQSSGQLDRLRDVRARLDRLEADQVEARRERSEVGRRDPLLPHDLDDRALAPLRDWLAGDRESSRAWLVRKAVVHSPERPLFLLVVRALGRSKADGSLVDRLVGRVTLPGQVLILADRGPRGALARRVGKSPGSDVYQREGPAR